MKKLLLITAVAMMVQFLSAQDLANLFETNKHSVVTIYTAEEVLLGGDIILQIDDIPVTGDESVSKLFDYVDSVESIKKHKITVLRAGELMDFYWISSDF